MLTVILAAFAAFKIMPQVTALVTPRDYHNELQLAQAVKEHYGATYAGCGKNAVTGKYACVVTDARGAGASYTVTVSADGKSWSAS